MKHHNQPDPVETTPTTVQPATADASQKPSARLISSKAQVCGTNKIVRNGATRATNSPSDKVWCNCKK